MSFKSIDMQLAVHKSPDVGITQSQLIHKAETDQSQLAGANARLLEQTSKRSTKVDDPSESRIRHQKERPSNQPGKRKRKQSASGQEMSASQSMPSKEHDPTLHPYKGHLLDLSL